MRFLIFICAFISFGSFAQRVDDQQMFRLMEETAADKSLDFEKRRLAYSYIIHRAKNQTDSVIIDAYRNLSSLARYYERYDDAIAYCDTVLEKFPKMDFVEAKNFEIDRADLYTDKGNGEKTMSEYLRILREFEKKGYKLESAKLHNRIALNLKKTDRIDNAIDHLEEAIRLSKEVKNIELEASILLTIGNCYKAIKDFDSAEENYLASIAISKENNFQRTLAGNYNGMGSLMRQRGRLKEAMAYYKKAIIINIESKNDKWLSYNYNNIGNIHKDQGQPGEALRYFQKSLEIKGRMKDDRGKVLTYLNISDCYSLLGDYKNAYAYRKMYIEINDSLNSIDQARETQKLAAQYQSEKREAEIIQLKMQGELDQQKLTASEERIRYQNFLGWLIGVAAVLFLAVAIILWYSARSRKLANEQLEERNVQIRLKNEQLDIQHKEIKSSINYAKRIQSIILPSHLKMNEYFKKYSILFMPKDIVSGDFYLFEPANGGAFFGVVDCTGHGVPGAMMSLVGSAYLSKAIKEKNLQSPAAVLDFVNQEFPKALTTNDITITDGMDLALCFVNSDKTKLSFAGAHRNCWVMNSTNKWREREFQEGIVQRFDDQNVTLLELKGNRQGIGKTYTSQSFDDVQISVYSGDRIVLFTDGFVDQFGGESNKKFRTIQLRKVLVDNMQLSAKEIENVLLDSINDWRQDQEQIDDICVMVVDI